MNLRNILLAERDKTQVSIRHLQRVVDGIDKLIEHWDAIAPPGSERAPNVAYTVNWKPVHVLLWEERNGPVPAKHCVSFKDGNRANVVYENLKLMSRAENARRNKVKSLKRPRLDTTYQLH